MKHLILTGLLCAAATTTAGGEYAVLKNGFVLHVDRHETVGDKIRLHSSGGYTEVDAAAVERFEPEIKTPAAPERADSPSKVEAKQLLDEAAKRYGIPAQLLHSLARTESGYNQSAVSSTGAIGIMQLMPDTARKLGADPHDPRQNVEAGTKYLADLLRKYADDDYQLRKALAAYNAGPAAVDRHNGVPPYRETMQYVERVIKQSGLQANDERAVSEIR